MSFIIVAFMLSLVFTVLVCYYVSSTMEQCFGDYIPDVFLSHMPGQEGSCMNKMCNIAMHFAANSFILWISCRWQ